MHSMALDFINELSKPKPLPFEEKKRQPHLKTIFVSSGIKWEDHLALHCQWVFKNISAKTHSQNIESSDELENKDEKDQGGLVRYVDGIQSVTRCALNIRILAHLYRNHQNPVRFCSDVHKVTGRWDLTEDDMKGLQIAALFYNSANSSFTSDKKKKDKESAINLYQYLTIVLKVNNERAKLLAEALANKDSVEKDAYESLAIDQNGEFKWIPTTNTQRNLFQKLLHDAICLDRTSKHPTCNARFLDFYKDCAINDSDAFQNLAELMRETRSVIAAQGDNYLMRKRKFNQQLKLKYNHENAYQVIDADYSEMQYPVMRAYKDRLFTSENRPQSFVDQTRYDSNAGMTDENNRAALREGRIFGRAINCPSAIFNPFLNVKPGSDKDRKLIDEAKRLEKRTMAQVEFGILKEKKVNPDRSWCSFGNGAFPYGGVGVVRFNKDFKGIKEISKGRLNTGFQSKPGYDKQTLLSPEKAEEEMKDLIFHQNEGLEDATEGDGIPYLNSEIISDVTWIDGFYYSQDPTVFNEQVLHHFETVHPHAFPLQAIYEQKEYEKIFKVKLPIWEYSGLHNYFKRLPDFNDEKIIKMWGEICSFYIKDFLYDGQEYDLIDDFSIDVEDIKTRSVYKKKGNYAVLRNASADSNYDLSLKTQINKEIIAVRDRLFNEYIQQICRSENSILTGPILKKLELMNVLNHELVKQKLKKDLLQELKLNNYWELVLSSFRNDKMRCLYQVAKQLKIHNCLQEIQAKAKEIIDQIIERDKKALSNDFSAYNFRILCDEILTFANTFGIENHGKTKVKQLIQDHFSLICKQIEMANDLDGFVQILSIAKNLGQLDKLKYEKIKQAITVLEAKGLEDARKIPSYLGIIEFSQSTQADIKTVILRCLNNDAHFKVSMFYPYENLLYSLKTKKLLMDKDILDVILSRNFAYMGRYDSWIVEHLQFFLGLEETNKLADFFESYKQKFQEKEQKGNNKPPSVLPKEQSPGLFVKPDKKEIKESNGSPVTKLSVFVHKDPSSPNYKKPCVADFPFTLFGDKRQFHLLRYRPVVIHKEGRKQVAQMNEKAKLHL